MSPNLIPLCCKSVTIQLRVFYIFFRKQKNKERFLFFEKQYIFYEKVSTKVICKKKCMIINGFRV